MSTFEEPCREGLNVEFADTQLNVAILIKQVPRVETMSLGTDMRLVRDGVDLETNPYCRRAIAKAVELARGMSGRSTAFTLGPPRSADCLRDALASGVDRGVLISDPSLAGSDTLATARALARAMATCSPFDLILAGRTSVDADTGQVPPQLAELLGLPFVAGARSIELIGRSVHIECEDDDGWSTIEVELPVVVSCAERLCSPAKATLEQRAAVDPKRIVELDATALGHGPFGAEGSRTRVGEVRSSRVERLGWKGTGRPAEQVRDAVALLATRSPAIPRANNVAARVPDGREPGGPVVAVLCEPGRALVTRELLGAAATIAEVIGGTVCALGTAEVRDSAVLRSWGADEVVEMTGSVAEQDVAWAVAAWCEQVRPWAVLAPGTTWGREVAARVATRLDAGLTGDAVAFDVDTTSGRLVGFKPAFGGAVVVAITATSALQIATARPGVLTLLRERDAVAPTLSSLDVPVIGRARRVSSGRDDHIEDLSSARVVVGVGLGVDHDQYPLIRPLVDVLGAELAGTRKVTDRHWLARSRQVGVTGRSIAPELYIAIGISGKLNHLIGVRSAGTIIAINSDPRAPIFDSADIGIIGDWRQVVPLLVDQLAAQDANRPRPNQPHGGRVDPTAEATVSSQ